MARSTAVGNPVVIRGRVRAGATQAFHANLDFLEAAVLEDDLGVLMVAQEAREGRAVHRCAA